METYDAAAAVVVDTMRTPYRRSRNHSTHTPVRTVMRVNFWQNIERV